MDRSSDVVFRSIVGPFIHVLSMGILRTVLHWYGGMTMSSLQDLCIAMGKTNFKRLLDF